MQTIRMRSLAQASNHSRQFALRKVMSNWHSAVGWSLLWPFAACHRLPSSSLQDFVQHSQGSQSTQYVIAKHLLVYLQASLSGTAAVKSAADRSCLNRFPNQRNNGDKVLLPELRGGWHLITFLCRWIVNTCISRERSAALEHAIDHAILILCLEIYAGISRTALDWFRCQMLPQRLVLVIWCTASVSLPSNLLHLVTGAGFVFSEPALQLALSTVIHYWFCSLLMLYRFILLTFVLSLPSGEPLPEVYMMLPN